MKYRKLLCVAMVLALLLGLSGSGLALTLDTITTGPMGTVTGIVEEKIFSKATLEDDFADDRVLVVLNNAASLKLKTYTAADFPEISCASVSDLSTATKARVSAKLKGEDIASTFAVPEDRIVFSDFYEEDVLEYNQLLCLELLNPGKQNVLDAIAALESREDILCVEPDYAIYLCSTTPNDPHYNTSSDQWNMKKIKLPEAWDISTGSAAVLVGIIDTGIDASHDDLLNRVYKDPSRDFSTGGCLDMTSVTDSGTHGTNCAGIIAAQGNNGIGIAGVAWKTRVVSLQVYNSSGGGTARHIANAINHAKQEGIPILNISLGTNNHVLLRIAIDQYPGLIVCAAGNYKSDEEPIEKRDIDDYPIYPASFPNSNIITVGSSSKMDTVYVTSKYGKVSVDLFAPGELLHTTFPGNSYACMDGTSMAAPHVAGVAALMLAECPVLTTAQLKNKIMNYTDFSSAFSNYCVSGGRLNAYKALLNVHTFSYTHTVSSHTGICPCGEVKIETHTFTNVGVQYVCMACGYITTSP